MEELQFSPSPAVWTQVQNEVRHQQQKQKRRVGFLFFFLLLALALAGVFYLSNSNISKPIQLSKPEVPSGRSSLADSLQGQPPRRSAEVRLSNSSDTATSLSKSVASADAMAPIRPARTVNTTLVAGSHGQPRNAQTSAASNAPWAETGITKQGDSKTNGATAIASTNPKTSGAQQPNHDSSVVSRQPSAAKGVDASQAKQQVTKTQPPRPWKFGFSAAAGASSSVGPRIQQQIIATPYYGTLYGGGTLTLLPGVNYGSLAGYNVQYSSPNPPRPKASFSLGFFAEKPISHRLSLSIGLSYQYNSTQTKTGAYVDSNISVSSNGSMTVTKDGFYQQGTSRSYTNAYHVIQLPLVADYLISKTNKIPLTAELGLSVGEIIASNALLYDYPNFVYFKQSHAISQTQATATAALLLGIRSQHITYRLGPQVQYGMTNLWKPDNGQNQHMMFLGIKLAMIPWQK